MTNDESVAHAVIGAAIEVHRTLGGPGLIESVYEEALCWELASRELLVERQKPVPLQYKGRVLSDPLRLDVLVEGVVVVECKAVAVWNDIFTAQALTYLRLAKLRLAIVINFGERLVRDGLHRVVNGY